MSKNNYNDIHHWNPSLEEEKLAEHAMKLFDTLDSLPWFLDFNNQLKIWKLGNIWNEEATCLDVNENTISKKTSPFSLSNSNRKDDLSKISEYSLEMMSVEDYINKYLNFFHDHKDKSISRNIFIIASHDKTIIKIDNYNDLEFFEELIKQKLESIS